MTQRNRQRAPRLPRAGALCALLLAWPAPLLAAEPALLHLDYQRSADARACMEERALARAVEQRLGRRVFVGADAADLRAQLRADREAGVFRIELELFDRAQRSLGRRQLRTRARHCSALDDSLALVVSLAADLPAPARDPPAGAPVPAPPLALGSPIEIPAETPAPRASWRVRPSLGVAAFGGFLPGLGLGLSAEVELTAPQFWPLFVRASAYLNRSVEAGAARAQFRARSVELGVCPWLRPLGKLESRLCAQQWIGSVEAEGRGFDREQSQSKVAFALGASETLSIRLGDWFISVSGALLAPLVHRRYFYVDDDDTEITLHDPGWIWVSGIFSAGFEL